MKSKKQPQNTSKAKPKYKTGKLSLYPLKFKEALSALLQTKPMPRSSAK